MYKYEEKARREKAQKMAQALRSAGISAETARLMTEPMWTAVAQAAGCNAPGSEETKLLVYQSLEQRRYDGKTVREWRNAVAAAGK